MASRNVDEMFRLFVESRDPRWLAAVFDRTAPELLRVAYYVTGRADQAEDLLQSTYLRAIERATAHDPQRPVLPWLLGILANRARTLQRAERRRARRVGSPRPQPEDPAMIAERRELMAILLHAQDELPDPYRVVLDLHLQHGLSAGQIARTLRRPAGTVRSQITRGLEQLRRKLPRGVGAGGLTWTLPAPGSLEAVREVVLARAMESSGTGASAAALAVGVISMKTMVFGVSAVFLLLLGGTIAVLPLLGNSEKQTESGEALVPVALPRMGESVAASASVKNSKSEGAATIEPERQVVTSIENERGSLLVTLKWKDGDSVANCAVVVYANEDGGGGAVFSSIYRSSRTRARGTCLFEDLPAKQYRVRPLYPIYPTSPMVPRPESVVIAAGMETKVDFVLKRHAYAEGTVVDAHGQPVTAACIVVEYMVDRAVAAETDATGHFRIPIRGQQALSAQKAGYAPSKRVWVEPMFGATVPLTLMLPGPGGAIRGRVTDSGGRPMEQVGISVDPLDNPDSKADEGFGVPQFILRTDAKGVFRVDGASPGRHEIQVHRRGFAPLSQECFVRTGRTTKPEIAVPLGAAIFGRVTNSNGEPVRAFVSAKGEGYNSLWCRSSDDGRYRLGPVQAGDVELASTFKGARRTKHAMLVSGSPLEWNPVFDVGQDIRGCVVDQTGKPLAKMRVFLYSGQMSIAHTETDARGSFVLDGFEQRSYHLSVGTSTRPYVVVATLDEVRPGAPDYEIRVRSDAFPTAHVRGKVLGADGNPASSLILAIRRMGVTKLQMRTDRAGNFDSSKPQSIVAGQFSHSPLVPGLYTLGLSNKHDGIALQMRLQTPHAADRILLGNFEARPHETADLGTLCLPDLQSVQVSITDRKGQVIPSGTLRIDAPGGWTIAWMKFTSGSPGSIRLPTGRYLVTMNKPLATRVLEVRKGQKATLHLRVRDGLEHSVRFADYEPAVWHWNAIVVWVRDTKNRVCFYERVKVDKGTVRSRFNLPRGSYRVELRDGDGVKAEVGIVMQDGRPTETEVQVR